MSIASNLLQIATNLMTVLNNCKESLKSRTGANINDLNDVSSAISDIVDVLGDYSSGSFDLFYDVMRTSVIGVNIRKYACAYNNRIVSVTLPHADLINEYAFYDSRNIKDVYAPNCTFLANRCFGVTAVNNAHLETIVLGDVAGYGEIDTGAFYRQSKIKRVDLSRCSCVLPYDSYFPAVSDLSQITVVVPRGQLQDWIDEGWDSDGITLEEASE